MSRKTRKHTEQGQEFEREEARQQARASWFDLFRGSDRRRTEIAFMAWACQSLCGSGFVGNTAYIMEQAGISQSVAFRFSYGSTVITVAANVLAFWFFSRFGRRTIYLVGQSLLFLGLIIIGSCGVAVSKGLKGSEWAQASFQVVSRVPIGSKTSQFDAVTDMEFPLRRIPWSSLLCYVSISHPQRFC